MNNRTILFDLDGTLMDSKEGILNCVRYALRKMGAPIPPEEVLQTFIGPPLVESFAACCGFTPLQAQQAVEHYRERFGEVGLFENSVYDGVYDLLDALRAAGLSLSIATSKPEVYARRIVERFELAPYFDHVCGAELNGTRIHKDEVIAYALQQYAHVAPEDFLMVGDRKHDMEGAAINGITAVGVLYGYGSRDELASFNPAYLATTPKDLETFLLK